MVSLQEKLLLTDRGQKWLSQFPGKDRETAARLVRSLTLVSFSKFNRSIQKLIEDTARSSGYPVALFAARELEGDARSQFDSALNASSLKSDINAVPVGNDLGSEARVAATIRSLSKDSKKYLNHPNVTIMRDSNSKCKAIFIIDDLVGSGDRIKEYLSALWANRSIRSWWSRKSIKFYVISFATTEYGENELKKLKCAPSLVYNRVCPTIRSLPWAQQLKSQVENLCESYGARTSEGWYPLGYKNSGATLVFEHGCPDNVSPILWASSTPECPWQALFPARSVLSPEDSAFPPEIIRRDPLTLLVEAGQKRLAEQIQRPVFISRDTLLVLAYAAKGIRRTSALSFATGMDKDSCEDLVQSCVSWGFLTTRLRLTRSGLAEIEAARRNHPKLSQVASIGEDVYYPVMLRKAT